jgi:hypothetical protein
MSTFAVCFARNAMPSDLKVSLRRRQYSNGMKLFDKGDVTMKVVLTTVNTNIEISIPCVLTGNVWDVSKEVRYEINITPINKRIWVSCDDLTNDSGEPISNEDLEEKE